jgi:hypothetical protein
MKIFDKILSFGNTTLATLVSCPEVEIKTILL